MLKQSDMKALVIIDAFRDVDYIQLVRELVPGVADAGARRPRLRGVPDAQEPHLHGAGEAPRLLLDARAAASWASTPTTQLYAEARAGQSADDVHQHAVHVGHDRLPQGRHAHEPQHPQQRLLHRRAPEALARRPRLPARAVLPLLRHRARRAGRAHARRDDRRRRAVRPAARARGGPEGARDRALRRADDVHRRAGAPDVRHVRPHLAAHGHHGRLAVPDRDDEAGHRQDARVRDDDLLRPDRDVARVHADDHGRHARAQVRDGRPQARRRWRCASSTPRRARTARRTCRASCAAAATTS